ncbi:carbohydrate ABC transporter permease [Cellulomonas sp. ATA003]|uniref:carbohydrate ABC transporter permease n=1 Tax=Cellulomonas sp. ATA003 TaxID=3073064 RepID=UPI002873E12A|nr:carbohydrate ABC transporter permease [Cellulomonas sp. ATA003]WNB86173.1 carbohydrate ABC transporter permease [Cellulomonas sp. ATA003]
MSRVGIIVVGAVFFAPFVWMLASSLKPSMEVLSSGGSLVGSSVQWSNYATVWTSIPFARIMLNTFFVAATGALLAMVVSLLSAYAFSRLTFRYRDRFFLIFLGSLVLPQEVLIVPLYIMANRAGLVDTYAVLIVPFAFGAFGAFMLRQFLLTLPRDYEEAARLDGAGQIRILWHVITPLLRAPLSVVGAFIFIEYWNSFLWPLIVINSAERATIPLGLQMFSGSAGRTGGR